jgi:hypothetical protein
MQEWKQHYDNKMSNNHHTIRGWLLRVCVQASCFTNSWGPLCTWSQCAIIKCLCLKVQQSFFATNKLWCLGSASLYFPRFPNCGSGKIGCVTGSLYDPGNEHWNFSLKVWVLWKQSGETLVANPHRKFKVGFSVWFDSWEGSPNYLDLVFTEFAMEILTPISVFLASSVGYSAGCSDVCICWLSKMF